MPEAGNEGGCVAVIIVIKLYNGLELSLLPPSSVPLLLPLVLLLIFSVLKGIYYYMHISLQPPLPLPLLPYIVL